MSLNDQGGVRTENRMMFPLWNGVGAEGADTTIVLAPAVEPNTVTAQVRRFTPWTFVLGETI